MQQTTEVLALNGQLIEWNEKAVTRFTEILYGHQEWTTDRSDAAEILEPTPHRHRSIARSFFTSNARKIVAEMPLANSYSPRSLETKEVSQEELNIRPNMVFGWARNS